MFLLHEILGSLLQVRGNKGVQVYDSMAFSMTLAPRHREMPGNLSLLSQTHLGKKWIHFYVDFSRTGCHGVKFDPRTAPQFLGAKSSTLDTFVHKVIKF